MAAGVLEHCPICRARLDGGGPCRRCRAELGTVRGVAQKSATLDPFTRSSLGQPRDSPSRRLRPRRRSCASGGFQDQVRDLLRMGDERDVARPHLDRRRAHTLRHEAFEIGVDRAILGRDRVEARLRTPGGVPGLAHEQRPVKWLLHRIENARSAFRQIAREIAQECSLREPPFVAVAPLDPKR